MINLNVNNERIIEITQTKFDGIITVSTIENGMSENSYNISACDMVTLLNWYNYQKGMGNNNLTF